MSVLSHCAALVPLEYAREYAITPPTQSHTHSLALACIMSEANTRSYIQSLLAQVVPWWACAILSVGLLVGAGTSVTSMRLCCSVLLSSSSVRSQLVIGY